MTVTDLTPPHGIPRHEQPGANAVLAEIIGLAAPHVGLTVLTSGDEPPDPPPAARLVVCSDGRAAEAFDLDELEAIHRYCAIVLDSTSPTARLLATVEAMAAS